MSDYQISLYAQDVLLTCMPVSARHYPTLLALLRQHFSEHQGFTLQVQRRHEVRRLIEQGPTGIRLLGVDYHLETVTDEQP